MRRIVNGLLYDTETATEIVPEILTCERDMTTGSLSWSMQALFETDRGACFLTYHRAGWRGFLQSERARAKDGQISPLNDAGALKWCEAKKIEPDIVRKHFPIEEA